MIGDTPIVSGELHYPRIPREYWRSRLRMARAMGLDAVSTYAFWNWHEPREGTYDFTGSRDAAAFVRIAQEEGLDVILRPGPYVCAEWDFGGLPAWLLRSDQVAIRTCDPAFMIPASRFLLRLGTELAPLQRARGGPIVAVQLENEYGAFGGDKAYLNALSDALVAAGFGESPMYTIDQPGDLRLGSLDDLPMAVTFAPGDPGTQFVQLRALRPDAPLVCGEYWAGWFDHWGEPHAGIDLQQQTRDLRWMLEQEVSVNIYMFHGGTNFGFWNGANAFEPLHYQPTVTSYDYEAALDESGRPTEKYRAFREAISAVKRMPLPPVPACEPAIAVPAFSLGTVRPLESVLGESVRSQTPRAMEALDQSLGYVLYRTTLEGPAEGELTIEDVRDYAVVRLDGQTVGHLDRRLDERSIRVRVKGERAQLDILIENGGRINYGPKLPFERKGITRAVRFGEKELRNWEMFCLPLDPPFFLRDDVAAASGPAFYCGGFHLDTLGDTFLDVRDLRKGALWINAHNAGRFWDIGPQRDLYVPAPWLRAGWNEVVALDLFARETSPRLSGSPTRDV